MKFEIDRPKPVTTTKTKGTLRPGKVEETENGEVILMLEVLLEGKAYPLVGVSLQAISEGSKINVTISGLYCDSPEYVTTQKPVVQELGILPVEIGKFLELRGIAATNDNFQDLDSKPTSSAKSAT